jgi:hypothetical protein
VHGARSSSGLLSLADLAAAIAPGVTLRTATTARSLTLSIPRGRWTPPEALLRPELTLLVLSGCLLYRGPGGADLLFERDIGQLGPSTSERWRGVFHRPTVVAVLTPETIADLARIPGVAQGLLRVAAEQHKREVELRSVVGIYDVRDRIVGFFEHLARHVGRPEGTTTRIPLALEQKRIEEILAAGHTQATTAFRSLVADRALLHDADGWLFDPKRVRHRTRFETNGAGALRSPAGAA